MLDVNSRYVFERVCIVERSKGGHSSKDEIAGLFSAKRERIFKVNGGPEFLSQYNNSTDWAVEAFEEMEVSISLITTIHIVTC